jgi:hypothetical protein
MPEQALRGRVQDADDAGGVGVDDGVFGAIEDGALQGRGLPQQDFGLGVLVHLGLEEAVGFGEGLDVLSEGFVGIGKGEGLFANLVADGVRPGLQYVKHEGGQRTHSQTGKQAPACVLAWLEGIAEAGRGCDHQPAAIGDVDDVGVGHLADGKVRAGEEAPRFVGGIEQLDLEVHARILARGGLQGPIDQRFHADLDEDHLSLCPRWLSRALHRDEQEHGLGLAVG